MSTTFGRFLNDGKEYEITTPVTPTAWVNYLVNDEYHMEVSQTLQGASSYVKANYNKKEFTPGYRYFYILNHKTKKAFNPNYVPLRRMPDKYSCVHGVDKTTLTSECDEVQCKIEVMVPVSGYREIWTMQLKNLSHEEQELSLFSLIGLEGGGTMGGECVYDKEKEILYRYAFPYHVRYEDKAKLEKGYNYYYMFSDISAESYEMSRRRFFGCDDMGEYPIALKNETCSNQIAEAENVCGCLQHKFVIPAGETVTYHIQVGVAESVDEISSLKEAWNQEAIGKIKHEVQEYWENVCSGFYIHTPDENVNFFANYWLKKQITVLTRLNRGTVCCPVRNQLQDALGYSLVQPKEAKKYIYDILKLQKKDGYIKQWHMTDGSPEKNLCLLNHTDGPLWLVIATIVLINQIGDKDLFFEEVAYVDGEKGPIYEHLIKAVTYMYEQRGEHGLCLIGDGDWNDPINGLGRRGKGESNWSTLALIYCIKQILTHMIDDTVPDMREGLEYMCKELTDKVWTNGWNKDRFIVGYNDDGIPAGCLEDNDRLFLNTQTWALMAGVVTEEQMPIVLKNLKRLETPFGPALLDPPFREWDDLWGRISIKQAGTTENGSMYCHGAMFKAFSDTIRQDGDAAYDTIRRTLPTNEDNPPEINLQFPTYLSKYYFALKGSPNYGRSSGSYRTGTVAWMLLSILEGLLGIKATTKGLMIEPCIPGNWEKVNCTRKFKEATYHISLTKGVSGVKVNGDIYEGKYMPYEAGKVYFVEVGSN